MLTQPRSPRAPFSSRLLTALFATVLLVVATTASATTAVDPGKALDGFDEYVDAVMKEWKVPGLGVAIIHDNQLLLARGYGYRDLENQIKADGDTLFAIGSNSKSFTATVLATLQDEGKLDWEQPVSDTLSDWKLHDPVASEQMTAIDLLSHRSGLPRHDLLWYGSDLSRTELLRRLRHLEPTETFRAKFQYQNLMFMTAGILAEEIGGASWEDLVKARIFEPLGMARSNFSVDAMQRDDNFSYPHFHVEDSEIDRIPFRNIDAVGPAGSINSSPREMAKYVLMHLNHGALGPGEDAKRVLSESNAQRMQSPQMVIQGALAARVSGDTERGDPSYGLGLMVSSYRGHKHVFHGGGIDGFISAMDWLPNDGIGVVVLSNTSGSGAVPQLVTANVFDRLLGMDQIDWPARVRKQQDEARAAAKATEEQAVKDRHEGTKPSHALDDFTGSYQHPGYGPVTVSLVDGQLEMALSTFNAPLEHHHYDVFVVPKSDTPSVADLAGTKVQFLYAKDGRVDRVTIPLEPTLDDIVFKRTAGDEMTDPAFLERLTGAYLLGGMTAEVELVGDHLTLEVPGQPVYELVPESGLSFEIKGLQGFRVEFELDRANEASSATAMVAHQPNGTFRAERTNG